MTTKSEHTIFCTTGCSSTQSGHTIFLKCLFQIQILICNNFRMGDLKMSMIFPRQISTCQISVKNAKLAFFGVVPVLHASLAIGLRSRQTKRMLQVDLKTIPGSCLSQNCKESIARAFQDSSRANKRFVF